MQDSHQNTRHKQQTNTDADSI